MGKSVVPEQSQGTKNRPKSPRAACPRASLPPLLAARGASSRARRRRRPFCRRRMPLTKKGEGVEARKSARAQGRCWQHKSGRQHKGGCTQNRHTGTKRGVKAESMHAAGQQHQSITTHETTIAFKSGWPGARTRPPEPLAEEDRAQRAVVNTQHVTL